MQLDKEDFMEAEPSSQTFVMENRENNNMMMIKRGKAGGGCPTRLQMHAPASLEIDKVIDSRPANPFSESSKAIPLLSPLILSPDTAAKQWIESSQNNNNGSSNDEGERNSSSSTLNTRWEHPALASFPEPNLCNVFQKQCVFVNHGQ
ncbi:hypothetical protein PIB30_008264 [Stylosanthes scabra]|uniref:Uncharacterized protein n=1 Tax=Stylosanthes scabra TaxID=79078 RepID=A0ABU6R4N1_9FABA|nr:hypothetical protein [Stylosanthes scabra]